MARFELAVKMMVVAMFVALVASGCATIRENIPTEEYREDIVKTYPLEGVDEISISSTNGRVEYTFGEVAEISVRAEKVVKAGTMDRAREVAEKIQIDIERGKTLGFRTKLLQDVTGIQQRVDYYVSAPAGLRIDAKTTNGEIKVGAGARKVTLKTTNGAVAVLGVEGSGNTVSTSNGRIDVENMQGSAEISTSNGSVSAENCLGQITITTSNGEIEYSSDEPPSGDVSLKTSNGAVTVKLPSKSDLTVEASTSNGAIISEFSLNSSQIKRNSLTGTMNEGTHALTVRTSNGQISLMEQ